MDKTNFEQIRQEFPILRRKVREKELVYLDNAATSQKPEAVLRALDDYYRGYNANVHRGIHTLSEEATARYDGVRDQVAHFIHAANPREIVFTHGTTEGINLVANSWGRANLHPGDEVLITEMEHHSNIVPWQILQSQIGFTLRYIPITNEGLLDLSTLDELLSERTKLLSVAHVSNVLGTINPVAELAQRAHHVGARVLVDAAQSVPHMPVDVQSLDADFLVFSGHKMCGPTGVGVLYAKRHLLEAMPPFMGGGGMIAGVSLTGSRWAPIPERFEAGTPAIAEVIGLGVAIDFLSQIGMEPIEQHGRNLTTYACEALSEIPGITLLGPRDPAQRSALVSFELEGVHPHDLADVLDREGIAIRAGQHCTQPLHDRLGFIASARASFYLYNMPEEIDQLVAGIKKASALYS